MNFEIVKTVTKFVKKSKNTIIKYAPQILAVAGAGCFVAGTYCAIKETPEAMRRLEEKEALDPNMTKLQKVAVMAPAYKKTGLCVTGGLIMTGCAWKVEGDRFAEMAGVAATALANSRKLEDAAVKVVGEEKAQEIKEKAREEIPFDEDDPDINVPDEYRKVPCRIAMTGKTWYSCRKDLEDGMVQSIADLKDKGWLTVEELYDNLKAGQCDLDSGWTISRSDGFGYDDEAAHQELGYHIEAWEDEYHRLGWELNLNHYPRSL